MNNTLFLNKIGEIENVFNMKYTDGQISFIWNMVQKWREPTFLKTILNLQENFKPSFNVPLPLPAHFNEIRAQLNIQEEQEWKKNIPAHEPVDDAGYIEYQRQVAKLMKALTGREDFKLSTSHVDGKFCCEVCFREGCNGKSEAEMRNGCHGFVSEAMNEKIIKKYGATVEERKEAAVSDIPEKEVV